MNVDSVNDPTNRLNSYISECLKTVNKLNLDPFMIVKIKNFEKKLKMDMN